jgi:BASS family bile acid:Na+ symporter
MAPTVVEVLKLLVRVAVPLAAFATGLRAAHADPRWLARHPQLFARALLTILLIVPVGVVAFLQSISATPVLKAGLTMAVIAVGIGPPAFFGRTKGYVKAAAVEDREATRDDSISFEVGLNVVLLALAIVYLPAFVAVHGAIFHHHLFLSPAAVAKVVLGRALIPLALGVVVGRLAPRVVRPAGKYAGLFVQAVLVLVVVVALIATWRALIGLGGRAWLTCAAVVLGEILLGHALGGPALETRRVLASFSAMRFPALALLLTQLVPRGRELVPVIMAYVLASVVLVGIHGALTSPRHRGEAGQRPGPRKPRMPMGGVPGRSGAA